MKTTSLELSRQLQEAGVEIETEFMHVLDPPDLGIDPIMHTSCCLGLEGIPAPTADELADVLPKQIKNARLQIEFPDGNTRVLYVEPDNSVFEGITWITDTPADALGLMALWLKKEGHLG